ncbi:DNA replication complex GINS protein PSF2 [Neocallimastix lanati (nom. inval.)]|uniref:DNA replication complex GINS protein PSF2 n=1 Tax=Neocallimastix californiae TaxID=1754190 RepID=A0A1Y2DRF2_9FUNG|nr:DNA replication complex GINS protein PSF2 [Neocallimastix sp. JGI-2020a]ORY61852.1 DNA replication complex GINS protein PSF2 [Neocallimastix californiae]|eukprot:ORY61852.1 DNA replication complex GINS protein PSF2 [Neocallimastix californiae]
MALPKFIQQNVFTPAEIEFISEYEQITILPLQRMETLTLLEGTYGPFRPPITIKVPLWLAVTLKNKHKCSIQPPKWLNIETLKKKKQSEEEKEEYSDLPFHYLEISTILLDCASDDIPYSDEIKILLKDIREIRKRKTKNGLKLLNSGSIQMDNLSLMEINEIRPFFLKAFNDIRKIEDVASNKSESQEEESQYSMSRRY